jgi:hypothetical protein
MSGLKDRGFGERLSTANDAKQAMTNKFLQRPRPDDPAMIEQRAARVAVNVAREARRAEREAIRVAEAARIAAEREAVQPPQPTKKSALPLEKLRAMPR